MSEALCAVWPAVRDLQANGATGKKGAKKTN